MLLYILEIKDFLTPNPWESAMPRMLKIALAAGLLALAALLVWIYYDDLLHLTEEYRKTFLAATVAIRQAAIRGISFIGGFLVRFISKKVVILLLIPLLPLLWRLYLEKQSKAMSAGAKRLGDRTKKRWQEQHWGTRWCLIGIFCVSIAGATYYSEWFLLLLNAIPMSIKGESFSAALRWIKSRTLVIVLRSATAKGLDMFVPNVLRAAPLRIKNGVVRPYNRAKFRFLRNHVRRRKDWEKRKREWASRPVPLKT